MDDIKYLLKFGIKRNLSICLINPNSIFYTKLKACSIYDDLKINNQNTQYDVILWWLKETDLKSLKREMDDIENKINSNGKVWIIIPKKTVQEKLKVNLPWEMIQQIILNTHFVDNKVASINDEEYGTQFVIRKQHRKLE